MDCAWEFQEQYSPLDSCILGFTQLGWQTTDPGAVLTALAPIFDGGDDGNGDDEVGLDGCNLIVALTAGRFDFNCNLAFNFDFNFNFNFDIDEDAFILISVLNERDA